MAATKPGNVKSNNREFPRVSRSCPVSYRVLENGSAAEAGKSTPAIMNNISGGGICFTSADPFEIGTMLALQVELPGFPAGVISMGRVVWCRPAPDEPGRQEIGVEFWWVGWKDESAQKEISSFIRTALDADDQD